MTWLKRNEWNLVLAVAVLAFGCGAAGLREFLSAAGKPASWPDLVYFTIRMFLFNYDLAGEGVPYGQSPWLLHVARFLAPATVTYAAVKGFMLAAAYQVNVWRLRRWQGHAVVCGAGKRGRQVALALRAEGRRVVVIEKDSECEALAELRAAGVRVVVGGATDLTHQLHARMEEASLVAGLTSSEESNLEVALAASRRTNSKPVEILVHASRQFAAIFERQQPFERIRHGVHARFFDHEAAAARLLLQEFSTELAKGTAQNPRQPRLLLAGDGHCFPSCWG